MAQNWCHHVLKQLMWNVLLSYVFENVFIYFILFLKKKKKVFCFSYFIWEVLGLHTEH